jgi:hypothetical protein
VLARPTRLRRSVIEPARRSLNHGTIRLSISALVVAAYRRRLKSKNTDGSSGSTASTFAQSVLFESTARSKASKT